jgi:hypothetical protein
MRNAPNAQSPCWAAIAGLCGALACLPGHAARPLVTDDPGVLERGSCEAEAVLGRDRAPGTDTVRAQSLQVGCGLGLQSQAALANAQERAGPERTRGLALVGKTALTAADAPVPLALGWALGWQRSPGTGWRHAETSVALLASIELAPGRQLVMNLAHVRDAAVRQGSTGWGVGMEQAAGADWAVAGELYGDDREAPWWNLGLRWSAMPERVTLDIAYGRQIAGGRPQRLSVGAKLSF